MDVINGDGGLMEGVETAEAGGGLPLPFVGMTGSLAALVGRWCTGGGVCGADIGGHAI
jgi:hypothetical protein